MRTNLVRLACVLVGFAAGRAMVAVWVWLWREECGQVAWAARNAEPDRKLAELRSVVLAIGRQAGQG